jgi:DNA-binding NarL/FixJ family response regulator
LSVSRGAERARVLIAADHAPTRARLRLALEPGAHCTEAADPESAVAAAERERPDVCLLDLAGDGRGLRTLSEIRSRVPGARVIVLSRRAEEDEFIAAMRAGASGYLHQDLDPTRLPHVVDGVLRGEPAVPRYFVTRLIAELRNAVPGQRRVTLEPDRDIELTEREWEVLELLRGGLPTREIAGRLGISQVTVRRHLSSASTKLGVGSRAAALRLLEGI